MNLSYLISSLSDLISGGAIFTSILFLPIFALPHFLLSHIFCSSTFLPCLTWPNSSSVTQIITNKNLSILSLCAVFFVVHQNSVLRSFHSHSQSWSEGRTFKVHMFHFPPLLTSTASKWHHFFFVHVLITIALVIFIIHVIFISESNFSVCFTFELLSCLSDIFCSSFANQYKFPIWDICAFLSKATNLKYDFYNGSNYLPNWIHQ